MKNVGSLAISLMMVLSLFGSFLTPSPAQTAPTSAPSDSAARQPPDHLQEVPAEIQDMFAGGMSIERFLSLNQGPVPRALREFRDERVAVILELEGAPLAELYAAGLARDNLMAATSQRAHLETLEMAQAAVVSGLESLDATVIDRYTKAYNGILVQIPLSQIEAARRLSGVKAVHPAPVHVPSLLNSIPLINADDVLTNPGVDGSGVTIAVIDTGIDYTHAALGGSGNPADYSSNDRQIIETGTFPTAKVIGGYDFAGPDYDASTGTMPDPDPDPLDGDGHGTHVSSTAAGLAVTGTITIGHGVAPGASLYALKVFGEPAGSTNLTVSAIEWAMDPDEDGDLSDHVDVINMSLGSNFGPATDLSPIIVASNNASSIGIVVAAASGNAGNRSYITGSPASADAAISVAASTSGMVTGPTIRVQGTEIVTNTAIIYQPPAFDNNTGHFGTQVSAPLYYVGENPSAPDDELCTTDGFAANALAGNLALIQRGTCTFSIKVNNAADLGAVGAIIFNDASGGNSRVTMIGDPVDIPAGFIFHDDGLSLALDHGSTTVVSAENDVSTIADPNMPVDTLAIFSSRGPRGFDSFLKPEITAPGVRIFAADVSSGTGGVALSGTSMATPHIAGVAALMKVQHPDWSPEQIKAAMMNTAVDLADDASAETPLQGAGRVDALKAATMSSIAVGDADLVSLSWGLLPMTGDDFVDQKTVRLQNFDTLTKTYAVDWVFGPGSFEDGFILSLPSEVEVSPSPGFAYVPINLSVDATQVPAGFMQLEEYYGYVIFSNTTDTEDVLRVPFYAVPQPYSDLTLSASSPEGIHGSVELQHSGPISSSVWAYPLYAMDANEAAQGDEGDLRMVGMDFGWTDLTYGSIFIPAFDVFGSWHVPQPFFAEFDLWVDADDDKINDFVDFNYNLSWLMGAGHDNLWVVIQVDLSTSLVFLGSPFAIFSDFNTGFMEWYLPTSWHVLEAADTDFDYQVVAWDVDYFDGGSPDATGILYFDVVRPPFGWSITGNPGPADPTETLSFWVKDPSGYVDTNPLGLMVVDYYGAPGVGQAHAYTFSIEKPFVTYLPIASR